MPNHYRLGFRANGMTVWDVDDARVDELGEQVGALAFVSHCYRRPRALPDWPYNLFAMVHGRRPRPRSRAARSQIAARLLGDACGARHPVQQPHPEEDRPAARGPGRIATCSASPSTCASSPGRRDGAGPTPRSRPRGPVVIWNLIRRCNLTCKHCYSLSADHDYPGELEHAEVFTVMDDLKAFQVPVLILSGGEPLLRPDLFEIARAPRGSASTSACRPTAR